MSLLSAGQVVAVPATWWGAASGKTDTGSTYLITNYTASQNRIMEDEVMEVMEVGRCRADGGG